MQVDPATTTHQGPFSYRLGTFDSYRPAVVLGYRGYQVLFLHRVREVHYSESEAKAACAALNAAYTRGFLDGRKG